LVEEVEERFAGVNGAVKASVLQSFSLLDDLLPFVETLLRGVSVGEEQLLASEERAYF
jgi:fatty acid synthase subunit alpha